ncbi:hypothetical protein G6F59_018656 [Rhizopus arrhizus]|nr:hypothetical protein G6F59_018656 [Rhizopus arrhizus]
MPTGSRAIRTATGRSPRARTATCRPWPACAANGASGAMTAAWITARTTSPTACVIRSTPRWARPARPASRPPITSTRRRWATST